MLVIYHQQFNGRKHVATKGKVKSKANLNPIKPVESPFIEHRLEMIIGYRLLASDAVLLLSATPVQLGSRNLFTLLNLPRPDLFLNEKVFTEMVAPNKYTIQAMRHIRARKPQDIWQIEAANSLASAAVTSWGQQVLLPDVRFTDWWAKSLSAQVSTNEARVRCLRDLEEIHTLARVMNRTRRRDIGRFTVREPLTLKGSREISQT